MAFSDNLNAIFVHYDRPCQAFLARFSSMKSIMQLSRATEGGSSSFTICYSSLRLIPNGHSRAQKMASVSGGKAVNLRYAVTHPTP